MVTAPLGTHHRDVKQLRAWLRDRTARASDGVFVAEGRRVVDALVGRGRIPRRAYRDPDLSPGELDVGAEIVDLAPGIAARIGEARTSQGLFAVFDRTPEPARRAAVDRAGLLLVLTRGSDPGNLGTIARSAEAAGFDAMVIGPGSVDPYNPKAVRAGAGAIDALPIWEGAVQPVLEAVAARGGTRLGADATGPICLDDAPLTATPLALVLGHETDGLPELAGAGPTRGLLDGIIAIPMAGPSDSLNVAMAASVLCFETARRRRQA